MRCSLFTDNITEITICTSECMIAVYITMTQKNNNLCVFKTVAGNKESYSKKKIKYAEQARELYEYIV